MSPAPSAPEFKPESDALPVRPPHVPPAVERLEACGNDSGGPEPLQAGSDDAEAAGIEDEFRRKLGRPAPLPPSARAAALRAARDTRAAALLSLRQRQAGSRYERQLTNLWRRAGPH